MVYCRWDITTISIYKFSPGNWPGQPMSEFEKFIHPSVDDIFTSEPTVIVIASVILLHQPCLNYILLLHPLLTIRIPSMSTGPSLSLLQTFQLLCRCLHRASASISQYQAEAANNNLPPLARIRHFKAGLQWEITVRP